MQVNKTLPLGRVVNLKKLTLADLYSLGLLNLKQGVGASGQKLLASRGKNNDECPVIKYKLDHYEITADITRKLKRINLTSRQEKLYGEAFRRVAAYNQRLGENIFEGIKSKVPSALIKGWDYGLDLLIDPYKNLVIERENEKTLINNLEKNGHEFGMAMFIQNRIYVSVSDGLSDEEILSKITKHMGMLTGTYHSNPYRFNLPALKEDTPALILAFRQGRKISKKLASDFGHFLKGIHDLAPDSQGGCNIRRFLNEFGKC